MAFPLLALLVMPWGARDEPLRSSYRNALRQTWLRTAHVVSSVLFVGIMAVVLVRIQAEWWRMNPFQSWVGLDIPNPPPLPEDLKDPSYQQALADYQASVRQYNQQLRQRFPEVSARRPWYVKNVVGIIVFTALAAALWVLWGLFRSVGASRRVPPITRPPTCETCGYNLTTIPMESRCPECGEAVVASLGPDARAGTVWQRRWEVGRWVAWWQGTVTANFRPRKLGRQLRMVSPGTQHRVFLALHLPVIFLIGVVGTVAFLVAEGGVEVLTDEPAVTLTGPSMFGFACVAGAVMFANLAGLVVGLIESLRHGRNLLPGTIQVACYLAGYLVVWALFGAAIGLVIAALAETHWFEALEILTGIGRYDLAGFTWLLPNVVWGIWYFALVARGTAGARYANR